MATRKKKKLTAAQVQTWHLQQIEAYQNALNRISRMIDRSEDPRDDDALTLALDALENVLESLEATDDNSEGV